MYLNGAEKVVYGLQPVEPRPPAEPSRMLLEIVETNQAGSTASTGPRMPASTGILLKDELPEGCLELLQDGSAQWTGSRRTRFPWSPRNRRAPPSTSRIPIQRTDHSAKWAAWNPTLRSSCSGSGAGTPWYRRGGRSGRDGRSAAISRAPGIPDGSDRGPRGFHVDAMLDVGSTTGLRESTDRPCPSVRRPSSKPTCSGGTPTRRDTAKFSMHSRIVDAHLDTPGVEHSLGRGHGELGLAHARGAQERAPRERTSLVGNPARDRRVASP